MEALIKAVCKLSGGTTIIAKWKNDLEIKGKIDSIYLTDNGLSDDEEGYKEFYACLIWITEIVKESAIYSDMDTEDYIYVSIPNQPVAIKPGYVNLIVGNLIDISSQNTPLEIKLEDGTVIWSKDTVSTEIWKTYGSSG